MAKSKRAPEARPVVDKPKVEAVKEVKSSVPTLKKAIVNHETLMKLQDERRLVGYDPRTGEATYKEA